MSSDNDPQIKKNKKIILIILVIVVLSVVLLGVYITKNKDYNLAIDLKESDEILEAAEVFRKLGYFKDSKEQLQECNYLYGENLYQEGNYGDAADVFMDLGNYKDSPDLLQTSTNYMKYEEALQLFSDEEFEQAEKLFNELGDFAESVDFEEKCWTGQKYYEAILSMDSGNYENAILIFESIQEYKDSSTMSKICGYKIMYIDAVEKVKLEDCSAAYELLKEIEENVEENSIDLALVSDVDEFTTLKDECYKYYCYEKGNQYFEEEKYYIAYSWFIATDIYDSAERAQDCIQPFISGEIYSNPEYSQNEVTVIFKSESTYSQNECIKITTSEDLVSVIAIKPGETIRISIPEGVYRIKGSNGSNWFGLEHFFGKDGHYYKVEFSEDDSFAGDEERKLFISVVITTIYLGEGEGNVISKDISYWSFLSP